MANSHNSANLAKGIAAILGGILLLLYTLGFMQSGINILIMLIAAALVVYGFIISGLYDAIYNAVRSQRK